MRLACSAGNPPAPNAPVAADDDMQDTMKLSLGPLPPCWPRERTHAFYRAAADWPVEIIHLGEAAPGNGGELPVVDWIELAAELADKGKQVVLSALALPAAASASGVLERLVAERRCLIEANDLAAVQLCRERGIPFVAGPALKIRSHAELRRLMDDGLVRWVPGVEQGREPLRALRDAVLAAGLPMPELEVIAYGRLPPIAREGSSSPRLDGIRPHGGEIVDLGPELPQLRELGVDVLRLCPRAEGMAAIVAHYHLARRSPQPPPRIAARNSCWHGEAGMRTADASRRLSQGC